MWETNQRLSKHLLLQRSWEDPKLLRHHNPSRFLLQAFREPETWRCPGVEVGIRPRDSQPRDARLQVPNTTIGASILCPFVLCRSPGADHRLPPLAPIGLRGQGPESPPQSPSLSGFQPGATRVLQRRPARRSALALLQSSARPSRRLALSRPPPSRGSVEASPRRPSPVEVRAASASPRLPREGARRPPRLHPLRGAAAIWGPCQARPLGARAQLAPEDKEAPGEGLQAAAPGCPLLASCGELLAEMPRGGGG